MRTLQEVCRKRGFKCALELAEAKRIKKENREHRQRKLSLKPLSHHLKLTQKVVNAYILVKEWDQPCCSCGTWDCEEFHAGHYRSIGAAAQLRFTILNIHKQCSECNTHKSGNREGYEKRLRIKIGDELVGSLNSDNSSISWTREELKEIRVKFSKMKRDLLKEQQQ